jgi:hypothetical protein
LNTDLGLLQYPTTWFILYSSVPLASAGSFLITYSSAILKSTGATFLRKFFKAKYEGVRSVGEPRKRWEDAVKQDAASFLRCRNWKLAANDRTLWRQKIEEAKARFGL